MKISVYTRVLIFNVLDAIQGDPSPVWALSSSAERNYHYQQLSDSIPMLIQQFVEKERINGQLTFFQGIHWLTSNLDKLCPFQKEKRRR